MRISKRKAIKTLSDGIIVHEWLEQFGGAEKVIDRLAQLYADAPIYALWNDAPGRFAESRVHETWLSRSVLRGHKAAALPLMPMTWHHLGRADAEWILCSSHLFAHHARFRGTAREARKYVYAYTPARYLWTPDLDRRGASRLARAAAVPLKRIDRRRAADAYEIAAISEFVRERIAETWERDARVIYPPVEVELFAAPPQTLSSEDEKTLDSLPPEFLLGASRFVPYKQLEQVIALGDAAKLPVVLAGSGPGESYLREFAAARGTALTIVGSPSQPLLSMLYRRALCYVFPPVEDFGIMPVEAMATGTPVLARSTGGAAETVEHGVSGVLVDTFDSEAALDSLDHATRLDSARIRARASAFDQREFDRNVRAWIG
jgi:glycosyltransferase involved in cell wall biosynthesis